MFLFSPCITRLPSCRSLVTADKIPSSCLQGIFWVALGFEVEESPDRGADGGMDLLVLESLSGTLY